MFAKAIVRVPSERLAQAQLTHLARRPVDVARAQVEHAAYVALLRAHGLELHHAPAAPEHPDGMFVEDVLVVIAGRAILTRPGAATRRGEADSLLPLLLRLALPTERIVAPATLDGGDVLVTHRHVLVGQSTRTNRDAITQLTALSACAGRVVTPLEVVGALHLKTALTSLPDGALIAAPDFVDTARLRELGYRVHHAPEASGANVLCLGQTVVLPAAASATARMLGELGYRVHPLELSEVQKLEAGVTCLSVLV